jgi:hypothetical protein
MKQGRAHELFFFCLWVRQGPSTLALTTTVNCLDRAREPLFCRFRLSISRNPIYVALPREERYNLGTQAKGFPDDS